MHNGPIITQCHKYCNDTGRQRRMGKETDSERHGRLMEGRMLQLEVPAGGSKRSSRHRGLEMCDVVGKGEKFRVI